MNVEQLGYAYRDRIADPTTASPITTHSASLIRLVTQEFDVDMPKLMRHGVLGFGLGEDRVELRAIPWVASQIAVAVAVGGNGAAYGEFKHKYQQDAVTAVYGTPGMYQWTEQTDGGHAIAIPLPLGTDRYRASDDPRIQALQVATESGSLLEDHVIYTNVRARDRNQYALRIQNGATETTRASHVRRRGI